MSMNQKQAPLHFPCRGTCFFLVIQPERGRQGTVLFLLFKGQMQETENRPLSPVSLSLLQFQTQRSEILNDLVVHLLPFGQGLDRLHVVCFVKAFAGISVFHLESMFILVHKG